MLIRTQPDGSLWIITQPTHAWLAGQLAEAWGNEGFAVPEPRDELILATHHHDDGWGTWEAAPTLGPNGRLPSFTEMDIDLHIELWRRGIITNSALSPFAALMTALHATALYRGRLASRNDPPEVRAKIEGFQAEAADLIRRLRSELARHPRIGPALPDSDAPRNYAHLRLLQVWDLISLLLCGGLTAPRTVDAVPALNGSVSLVISPSASGPEPGAEHFHVRPWPFGSRPFTLWAGYRHVPRGTFDGDADLQAALTGAPWDVLEFHFEP
jgi:hypothetical protein